MPESPLMEQTLSVRGLSARYLDHHTGAGSLGRRERCVDRNLADILEAAVACGGSLQAGKATLVTFVSSPEGREPSRGKKTLVK